MIQSHFLVVKGDAKWGRDIGWEDRESAELS